MRLKLKTMITEWWKYDDVLLFCPLQMDKDLSSTTRSKPRFTGKVRLCIARYRYVHTMQLLIYFSQCILSN